MSVIIRGMKMPESCSVCRMLEGDTMDGLCHAADMWFDDERFTWYQYAEGDIDDSKPANCPLIELPPHGRLIDGDVAEVITYTTESGDFADGILYAADWIANQPTIIEAEGEP